MTDEFQKPLAAPPLIFGVALLVDIALGLLLAAPIAPTLVRIPVAAVAIGGGVWLIRCSIVEITAANTTYDPYAPSTHLVTSGIYRRIRNPGYLGLAVIQFGFAALFNNYWIVVTLVAALLFTHYFVVLREEDKLRNTFGEDYANYVSSSSRWL
jgi:protein-S-isoprenylcysteine O-methyltransferase Ste14